MAAKNGPSTGGSGEFVTVFSKLPLKLTLQLSHRETTMQAGLGMEARPVEIAKKYGEKYIINGTAEYRGADMLGWTPPFKSFGFAVTRKVVPKAFWEAWCKEHHDFDALVNGFLFAVDEESNGDAQAKESANRMTGFDPMIPSVDGQPPVDVRLKGERMKVTTAERD